MSEKVVVGMSGGVDSSVAAALLKKQGYDVTGITMNIWPQSSEGGCCGLSAAQDARRVAGILDIPHYVLNFKEVFEKKVIDDFVSEYLAGRTPNPCIICNRYVKWEALMRRAREIGADYLATGHYAKIVRLSGGRLALKEAAGTGKDQTYALYSLTQDQLSHTLLPLGDYTKDRIRDIAGELGLPVADKPDSQDICFVENGDYAGFLEDYCIEHSLKFPGSGDFTDDLGRVLGRHKGIAHYTIGQRRGLGLPAGRRIYVTGIDAASDRVILGENESLFKNVVKCRNVNLMGLADTELPVRSSKESEDILTCAFNGDFAVLADRTVAGKGKIRYNHRGSECLFFRSGADEITAFFKEKVRAVTPGQAAVFYVDDHIAAGGTIISG